MKKIMLAALLAVLLWAAFFHWPPAHAQVVPAVNSALPNCSDGRDVIVVGSVLACSGGVPTIGTCGVSPALAGTDLEGKISAGSGILTSCTVNFSHTLSATPRCLVSSSLGAVWISAISATALTVTAASLTSGIVYYKCWGAS